MHLELKSFLEAGVHSREMRLSNFCLHNNLLTLSLLCPQLEDLNEDAIRFRHERCEVDEHKKFNSIPDKLNRRARRLDSRTDSFDPSLSSKIVLLVKMKNLLIVKAWLRLRLKRPVPEWSTL